MKAMRGLMHRALFFSCEHVGKTQSASWMVEELSDSSNLLILFPETKNNSFVNLNYFTCTSHRNPYAALSEVTDNRHVVTAVFLFSAFLISDTE